MLPFDSTLANFGAIASILGLVVAVVTLVFGVRPRLFRSLGSPSIDDETIPKANRASGQALSQTTLIPASPNLFHSLQQMLESAKSVTSNSDRSDALRLVAQHAVRHGAYEIAIEAGQANFSHNSKSETLKFVAISAARGGQFEEAARAAKEIPSVYIQGETTKKILEIQSNLEKGHLELQ